MRVLIISAVILTFAIQTQTPAMAESPTTSYWQSLDEAIIMKNTVVWNDTVRWIEASKPKPPAKIIPKTTVRSTKSETSTGRCGGNLPPCWVMNRESRGNINAYNAKGCGGRGCFGKWQCDPLSCNGTGTEAEQDAEAARLWAGGKGCANWAAC